MTKHLFGSLFRAQFIDYILRQALGEKICGIVLMDKFVKSWLFDGILGNQ